MARFRLDFDDKLLKQEVNQGVIAGLRISAEGLKADAKAQTPVDTGRLRASINSKVDEGRLTAEVGTNLEYAEAVEFGTSKSVVITPKSASVLAWRDRRTKKVVFAKRVVIPPRRGRPYLTPALKKWNGKYMSVIGAEIQRRIK